MRNPWITYPLLTGFSIALMGLIGLSLIKPGVIIFPKKSPNTPDFKLTDIRVIHLKQGVRVWGFYADRAEIYKASNQAILWNPKGQFFSEAKPIFELASPRANLNLETSTLEIIDLQGEWMVNNDRLAMSGKRFVWESNASKLIGKGQIQFKNDTLELRSDTVIADMSTQELVFLDKPNHLTIKKYR